MNENKIYLLKTHLKTENNEYLYKIGRSQQQGLKRLNDYPKTYKLIIMRTCINSIYVETELIKLFTKKYKKEFKNEYFVGNENDMINDINKIINDEAEADNLTNNEAEADNLTNDEVEADNLTKELIIIKSKISEKGWKIYYITDQKHNVLRQIINTPHMDWILNNDYYDEDDVEYPCIEIEENTLYDINDEIFINSITNYISILGVAKNVYKDNKKRLLKSKYKFALGLKNDEYSNLSINGKIVYLFEADTILDNLDGKYFITPEDELYLFSQAPKYIFEISAQAFSTDLLDFLQKNDLLIHYFHRLGTIKTLEISSEFDII